MKQHTLWVASFVVVTAASPVWAAKPGKVWDVKSEMPGMPMAMPAQQVCIAEGKSAASEPADPSCKMIDQKQSGNRYQWKAKCKEGTMEADFTVNPGSYQGTMKMNMDGQAMTMKVSGKDTGKACQAQN